MELSQYLDTVAAQLVNELKPILEIKGVTENTDLLGKYTEASIRSLVHRIVRPMRLSTGAVLDHPMPVPLRQIDLIVWAPFPAPALFDTEDFGLVPKSSAFGVIEVKRSNYSGVETKLEEFLEDVKARKIVSDPAGPKGDYARLPGLGVICVLESTPSSKLQQLLDDAKVVAIFERNGESTTVRSKDVLTLVNFLHFVTWRYRVHGAHPGYPQIIILKIKAAGLRAVTLADSDAVKPGQRILAIGHSAGLTNTITEGLVSGVRRADDVPELQSSGCASGRAGPHNGHSVNLARRKLR